MNSKITQKINYETAEGNLENAKDLTQIVREFEK